MDDGDIEISDQARGRDESSGNFPSPTCEADSFFDELPKNTATCTHTHMCNPPGPYAAVHTHTCYHTHTQVLASEVERDPKSEQHPPRAKRPSGNREAVRKYREKKKAHTAYLEEEVRKLHVMNQQLKRKLQGLAILEAEVVRLRSILVDLRSKMDDELASFPFQEVFPRWGSSLCGDGKLRAGKEMFSLTREANREKPINDSGVKTNDVV